MLDNFKNEILSELETNSKDLSNFISFFKTAMLEKLNSDSPFSEEKLQNMKDFFENGIGVINCYVDIHFDPKKANDIMIESAIQDLESSEQF